METPSMSEAASNSKLVDYDPDESSLEPGEVVTPPRVQITRKETDVCKEKVHAILETDVQTRQEERSSAHKNKSVKKEGNDRNSAHRSYNQDSNPFHSSSRKRHFNARRGRGYMRSNMSNYAHERWPKPCRDVPEAELLWTKVKPTVSYWFKGCKEFMKKLQNSENHKSKKTLKKSTKKSTTITKDEEKLKDQSKADQAVEAHKNGNSDNDDDDDDEVDAWEEHFKKSNNKKSNLIKQKEKKLYEIPVTPILTAAPELPSKVDIFEDTTTQAQKIVDTKTPSVNKEISSTPPRRLYVTPHTKINTDLTPTSTPTKSKKLTNNSMSKADDFDVLSIADLREQEAAEDRAKSLKNTTPTKSNNSLTPPHAQIQQETEKGSRDSHAKESDSQTAPIRNSEPLLSDVSKDFKKLKALDNNLQRLQKMRESFDPTDDIWEELCKMEALFQKQKNFILLKYAKTENADLLALNTVPNAAVKHKRKSDGNTAVIVNFNSQTTSADNDIIKTHTINANIAENELKDTTIKTEPTTPPTKTTTTSTTPDTGFLALNSTREAIKLKISPIKKPKSLQFNKKRNVLKQLWDDDDDPEPEQPQTALQPEPTTPAAAESSKEAVKSPVETAARQMRGVAIVKPIMEVKSEPASSRRRNREADAERRSTTADRRVRRRNTRSPQRRYPRSFSRSPCRNWPRRDKFSPQSRKRYTNCRRSSTPVQARRPRTPTCTPPASSYSRSPSLAHSPAFFKPPSPPAARSETPESLRARSSRSWSREPRRKSFRPRSPATASTADGYVNTLYGQQAAMYGGEYEQSYETANHHDQAYDIMQDLNGYYYNMQAPLNTPVSAAAGATASFEAANYANQQPGAGYNNYLAAQYYEADREMYANMSGSEAYASYTPVHTNVNQSVLKELAKAPAMAVQKGNVLEIVPIQNAESLKPAIEVKLEFKENAVAGKEKTGPSAACAAQSAVVPARKKTLNMKWLEEVKNRQMQATVLRKLPAKTTILKPAKNDQTESNLSSEHLGKKPLLKQKAIKKKVFFEDGIYPSRDSSEEDRKAVDEILMRKVKRLRKKLTDKQLKIIRLVAPELDEENISAELDSMPAPAPPEGLPAAHLRQPVYLRPVSPDTFVFFHYDPEVSSMFVSAYEHAIPPRLLDAKNKQAANNSGAMNTLMLPFITPQQQTDNARLSAASAANASSNAAALSARNAGESPPPTLKPLTTSRNEFVTQPLYPTTGPALMPHPPPMAPSPVSYYNVAHAMPYITQNIQPIEPLLTRTMPDLREVNSQIATALRHNSLI